MPKCYRVAQAFPLQQSTEKIWCQSWIRLESLEKVVDLLLWWVEDVWITLGGRTT